MRNLVTGEENGTSIYTYRFWKKTEDGRVKYAGFSLTGEDAEETLKNARRIHGDDIKVSITDNRITYAANSWHYSETTSWPDCRGRLELNISFVNEDGEVEVPVTKVWRYRNMYELERIQFICKKIGLKLGALKFFEKT